MSENCANIVKSEWDIGGLGVCLGFFLKIALQVSISKFVCV